MFNTMWVEGDTTDGQNEISLGKTFTLDLFITSAQNNMQILG
jgi:hypothetical protein